MKKRHCKGKDLLLDHGRCQSRNCKEFDFQLVFTSFVSWTRGTWRTSRPEQDDWARPEVWPEVTPIWSAGILSPCTFDTAVISWVAEFLNFKMAERDRKKRRKRKDSTTHLKPPLDFIESPLDGRKYYCTPVQAARRPFMAETLPVDDEEAKKWVCFSIIKSPSGFLMSDMIWA